MHEIFRYAGSSLYEDSIPLKSFDMLFSENYLYMPGLARMRITMYTIFKRQTYGLDDILFYELSKFQVISFYLLKDFPEQVFIICGSGLRICNHFIYLHIF